MLPLHWPRYKDRLTLVTFKNMTIQLDTFLPHGLQLRGDVINCFIASIHTW